MKNKYPWVVAIIVTVVVLDQITKHLVQKHIRMYDVIAVVPGFFNLTNVRNRGAAFGILSGAPGAWRRAFFIIITLAAVAALAILIRKTRERLLLVSFSLIAGGALGNVIDRLRFGEVIDFIDWHVRAHHWPSFNVADAAISTGVALLAIEMLLNKPGPDQHGETDKTQESDHPA